MDYDRDRTLIACEGCRGLYPPADMAGRGDRPGTFLCPACWLGRRDGDPDVSLFRSVVRSVQPPRPVGSGDCYTAAEFVKAVHAVGHSPRRMRAFVRGLAKLLLAPDAPWGAAHRYAKGNVGCVTKHTMPWWRRLWWRLAAGVKPGDAWYV